MKFRKKPVVIEAVQWLGNNLTEVFDFMTVDVEKQPEMIGHNAANEVKIHTLEGTMVASVGDWIIRGIKGEYYPCKPDIFESTYERVETNEKV